MAHGSPAAAPTRPTTPPRPGGRATAPRLPADGTAAARRTEAGPDTTSHAVRGAVGQGGTGRGGSARPAVAIAHDYLTQRGGAERVVLAMHRAFPEAPIYTTLYDPEGTYPEFRDATIITSPLNRVALLRHHHRWALPLLPFAASAMRVPADVVLVSTSGWAHGFRTDGVRQVYCHTPARWVYLLEQYLGAAPSSSPMGWAMLCARPLLERWDRRAMGAVKHMVANSTVVRDRIKEVYGRDVEIEHPPHRMQDDTRTEPVPAMAGFARDGEYFLSVSRLLPYKNVDRVMEAFRRRPERRLVLVGTGPLEQQLRQQCPENVLMLSNLTDAQMRGLYRGAMAVVAASHEDFGITPLEGFAFGRPTLALRGGGYLDTVVPGMTGAFFEEPTPEAIGKVLDRFHPEDWDQDAIRDHARSFSEERFVRRIRAVVAELTRLPGHAAAQD
ncbi:glycosyltransferase [Kocuria sp.]|uniref:glycosyltransferase n=1 Tax=Kocuria sp. TaxID=1871328 RepID=UPI0026DA6EA4|nr:glycosyltransferase [Kocuria sp.]MDO4919673.1 glycosyltransferase [Kocuria sp.]